MPLFGSPTIEKMAAKRNFKGLRNVLLDESSYENQRKVVNALASIGGEESVDILCEALSSTNNNYLKIDLCRALGKLGDRRAVPALIRDFETKPNASCLAALGQIGDPQAKAVMIDALSQSGGDIRAAALAGLAELGAVDAVEHILPCLQDEHPPAQRAAVAALDSLGWKPGKDKDSAIYYLWKGSWRKLQSVGAPAVEPTLAALDNRDKKIRQTAITALGLIGDQRAVRPLAAHAKAFSEDQKKVYQALGRLGGKAAIDELVSAYFESSALNIGTDIKKALLAIGEDTVEQILPYLDGKPGEKWAAIQILGDLGAPEAFNSTLAALPDAGRRPEFLILVNVLADLYQAGSLTEKQVGVLKEQVVLLSGTCPAADLKPLQPLLAGHTPNRDQRLKGAGKFLTSDNLYLKAAAIETLDELGEENVWELLEPLLTERDPSVQKILLKLVKKHGKEGILWLVGMLQSPQRKARMAAVEMLKKLYDPGKLSQPLKGAILKGLLGLRKTDADRHTDYYYAESESGAAHTDSIPEVNFHGLDDGRWYF